MSRTSDYLSADAARVFDAMFAPTLRKGGREKAVERLDTIVENLRHRLVGAERGDIRAAVLALFESGQDEQEAAAEQEAALRTVADADPFAQTFQGYADPREDDNRPVIAANWNRIPDETARTLERHGFHVEWTDQVSSCDDCGLCIRTEPDSHWWRPRFAHGEGEHICAACLERAGLRFDDRERWPEVLDPARLASVGVSADTLDPMDLIPRFCDALRDYGRGVLSDADWEHLHDIGRGPDYGLSMPWLDGTTWTRRHPDPDAWREEALEWLFDRLDDCAPEGYVFGSHEHDGACFGFWAEDADA
jgi:hypothetical protein